MKCGVVIHPTNFDDWQRVFQQEWNEGPATTDFEMWGQAMTLIDDSEELGFDKIWTTEHHESPYGQVPNPLGFLSMVAGRTEKLGVGTQVVVVPWWHNPIRIAEEIAQLDVFLEGRELIIGFGRGVAKREFDLMGISRDESRGRFAEGIEVVREALLHEQFSHHGEYFQVQNARIRPRPRDPEKLVQRMAGAFSGTESADAIARCGLGMITITGKPAAAIGEDVRRFNGIRDEAGLPPMQPIIQVCVICCEREYEVEENYKWFDNFETELNWHYRFSDANEFEGVKGYEAYAEAARSKTPWASRDELLFCGTPDVILDRLKEVQELTSAGEFVINPYMGGMPIQRARDNLRLFAKEVLPGIHEMEAPLHKTALGSVS